MATIKGELSLSDSIFGSVLFAMSAGVVLSLPVSGWIIAKLGSRTVGVAAIATNATLLALLPLASNVYQLAALLFLSGLSYSAVNVSNNTQASLSETISKKTELPFFHGIWGLAGFVGAGVGAVMIGQQISMSLHFGIISIITITATLICWKFLHHSTGREQTARAFTIPDKSLFNYGLIVFCSMACEGIMYDWSVIYFQDVVSTDRKFIGLGFMVFMGAMTAGRLSLNRFVDRFGIKRTLQWGGLLTSAGMVVTIMHPSLITSIIGFCLVGLGICTVIPLVAGAAAKSTTMAPSSAIASVLTIGFLGTLIGPPLIGFLSEAVGLRYAFIVCIVLAIGITYRAGKIPAPVNSENQNHSVSL
jgi:MFS family permease